MKRLVFALLWFLPIIAPVTAALGQFQYPQYADDRVAIPDVRLNNHSVTLQRSLFPEYYKTHSAQGDLRWVARNDSALVAFWEANGAIILSTLSELTGLPWMESEFNIYILRYYQSAGCPEPFIVPIGGIRQGHLVQAAPEGSRMQLNLVFQLAGRMLAQSAQSADGYHRRIAGHPLMQAGPYRRDLLAMLAALVTCEKVIGLDSTYDAYKSAFWRRLFPGREILEHYLLKEWVLSPQRPLAEWISEEPHASELVTLTRPPTIRHKSDSTRPSAFIEGLPLKGRFGFSVKFDTSNRLVVDQIDVERLAFACGLREGDIIRQVDGHRVRHHKDLIEKILIGFEDAGSTLQVIRENENTTVILRPIELDYFDEEYYWEETD
jgi:hypothetical protein